ncbi:MAG: glycine cleavage system protein GcvH [Aquificota bacterium]|jgi:glycine cleavage system H protein|nr:glycine cleavage system protein GcvH [Aquificaceae bacterium]MDM7266161.1 glycine cleavage system protein GcvH [Aquificaceae bacterium]QWK12828.1 MAG: glycine cleavage system protein GcvH [Aquificota bacterium]HAV40678.1 glycine cleavage system protein GcvH [Aquificaceae bacterium]HCO38813.1 glycine cleavage system protein GcvH [Aquificaceae bacterium]
MEDIIVGKYVVKTDRYYTKDHEWALVKGNKAWIGITDYAQKELGDVVYIDLPQVGESYESGDTIANVESVKSVSPIYAPLSGTVVEVNETLSDEPHLINESPYEDGWIAVLELSDPMEVEDLMPAEDYAQLLVEIVKEEKGEEVKLEMPEEEVIEESLEALPEEELGYEEREK